MKNIFKIQSILYGLLMILSVSCEQETFLKNAIYWSDVSGVNQTLTVEGDSISEKKIELAIRSASPVSENVQVQMKVDPELLARYSKQSGLTYTLLPESMYELESVTTNIEAGSMHATKTNLILKPYSKEMSNDGNSYAIPMSIASSSSNTPVLDGSQGIIYTVVPPVYPRYVPKVGVNRGGASRTNLVFKLNKDYPNLTNFTIEMLFNFDGFNSSKQVLFSFAGISGQADGTIVLRFGDQGIPGNTLQLISYHVGAVAITAETKFQANKWYHLALVYDGSLLSMYVNGNLDFSKSMTDKYSFRGDSFFSSFLFGVEDYSPFLAHNAMYSEVRFWNKAISGSQIMNNMYSINPQTPGLEAYWKLDEESGAVIKDATGNGNDGFISTVTPANSSYPPVTNYPVEANAANIIRKTAQVKN